MNARAPHWALIAAAVLVCGCSSADWPMFRQNPLRTAEQAKASPLSDPKKVENLTCMWQFPDPRPQSGHPHPLLKEGFRASPVVYDGRVFIGNGNGYFYALDAKTGVKLWQYPQATCLPTEECRPLRSEFRGNPSSRGIASSAAIARIGGTDAVIFAAPDPSNPPHWGDGRLFALNTNTGKLIWKSDVIAKLEGVTPQCYTELHENLGHSSPLVLGDKVYVGVGDHDDSPVQQGRVAAVYLANGHLVPGFSFCSTGKCGDGMRGGGVWSPPAGWKDEIYITTGNTRSGQDCEPCPNHGLSLLRLSAVTGKVDWEFQPVPWELDGDADWSAAPTIMSTSCGRVIISTQKDGWTHALKAVDGSRLWSFPPEPVPPFQCKDGTTHGDTRYMRSGAASGDVYVTMTGGRDLVTSGVTGGYHRLHAFNVCEPKKPLRWLIDVPDTCCGSVCTCPGPCCGLDCRYCLGNPTVTRGIVYIGTNKGHLVAFGDAGPQKAPGDKWRCENSDLRTEDCENLGHSLVKQPKVLASVKLRGSMVYTEPALANGSVYVSTAVHNDRGATPTGYVYMLHPGDKRSRCEP